MIYSESANKTTIKKVFDGYAEDTISEEQVQRVLAPILKLIREGYFDRPRGFLGIWKRKKRAV